MIGPLVDPGRLREALGPEGAAALDALCAEVEENPARLARVFPAAARRTGRGAVGDLRIEDAVRVELLAAPGADAATLAELYRYGDADEKRAVIGALNTAPALDGSALVLDALRTHDTRLVAAAMGPATAHLDDTDWRQGVLKCLFMEVPVRHIAELRTRADAELATMARSYARERAAAGRPVPDDVQVVIAACETGKEA